VSGWRTPTRAVGFSRPTVAHHWGADEIVAQVGELRARVAEGPAMSERAIAQAARKVVQCWEDDATIDAAFDELRALVNARSSAPEVAADKLSRAEQLRGL
jgi:hypothetical protein